MKVKITIPQIGYRTKIEIDGVDISRNVQGVRSFVSVEAVPVLQLDLVPEEVAIEFDRDFSPQELQVMEPLWDRLKEARHNIPAEDTLREAAKVLGISCEELTEFAQKVRKSQHGSRPPLSAARDKEHEREEELSRLNRMFDAND